jgi:hypothetical protein
MSSPGLVALVASGGTPIIDDRRYAPDRQLQSTTTTTTVRVRR